MRQPLSRHASPHDPKLSALGFEGLGADLGQGGGGGEDLDVEFDGEQSGLAALLGAGEGGGEIFGAGDGLAMGTVGAGQRREVGVFQIGRADPAGVAALLMGANRRQASVVYDN